MAAIITYPNLFNGKDYAIKVLTSPDTKEKICSIYLFQIEEETNEPVELFIEKFEAPENAMLPDVFEKGRRIVNSYGT